MIKTRIAPTPSGFLHLGNVLSFSLTAGMAAKMNAGIVLRIDDLDRERVRKRYVQDIFDTLEYLEIPWHEGPANFGEYQREHSQFHRLDLYREALRQLTENDQVFACDCSRSEVLEKSGDGSYPGTCRHRGTSCEAKNVSWRLRTIPDAIMEVNTLDGGCMTARLPAHMQEFIVRRKNGLPSYQLASMVDDQHYGINLIVRGEDLWDSTLAQLSLASALEPRASFIQHQTSIARTLASGASSEKEQNFRNAVFFHHQLLKGPQGKKLSKSTGTAPNASISVQYLRKQGKKPEEIYSLIGSMLQLREPVRNWQSLAAAVIA